MAQYYGLLYDAGPAKKGAPRAVIVIHDRTGTPVFAVPNDVGDEWRAAFPDFVWLDARAVHVPWDMIIALLIENAVGMEAVVAKWVQSRYPHSTMPQQKIAWERPAQNAV